MKRVCDIVFTLIIVFAIHTKLQSQVALYSFSSFTAPYAAISGGTVFGNAVSDDQVFINTAIPAGQGVGASGPGLPIGFTFTMNGNQFDRLGINCNGFIMFGTSSVVPYCDTYVTNAFLPISSTSTVLPLFQHKVVAFGMDIQGQATGAGSNLRMQTIGTAPNRTAVVQWTNYRKYNNSGDDYNFQIRLMETTNIIEVHYGSFLNNGGVATVQVGLRGALNNDFSNRFVNAINTWSNSAPGSVANTIANVNSNLLPSAGLVYRWTPPPMCSGTPATNSIVASPLFICPGGSSTLNLINTYTNSGINYQWQASTTSSTGPFSQASNGGITTYYANNLPVSTWYRCAVTCAASGLSNTTPPIQIQTTGALVSNVPFNEDFESIIVNNQLPNCSWASSNPSVICQTYVSSNTNNRVPRSGYGFAAFRYGTQTNGDLFYTNGIQLNAGVTYSASLWYVNDATPGWNYLSILYGTSQSTTGLVPIATITNNIANISYNQLSNTFSVTNSGVYFIAVRAYGSASTQYLCFDDLSITAPCSLNSPSLTISGSNTVICAGQQATLGVTGADTYTWSTGSNSSTITVAPSLTNTYTAIGTLTNSGCTQVVSQIINVNPTPVVSIFATPISICNGASLTMYGFGADNYTWSTGATIYSTTVSPSLTTTYSLIGTNVYGCLAETNLKINVLPSPTVSAYVYPTQICAGESATLSSFGAGSFEWRGTENLYSKSPIFIITPTTSVNFTLTGTANNGCQSTAKVSLLVNACTDIENLSLNQSSFSVFPNPFKNSFTLQSNGAYPYHLKLYDANGKLILEANDLEGNVEFSEALKSGLYFIFLQYEGKFWTSKLIKE